MRQTKKGELSLLAIQKIYLSYSIPCFPTLLIFIPTTGVLQGIYAKHYGISLATIGTIVLISRISDALTDPLVGFYSDKIKYKTGTRSHLIILGAAALLISAYFLFNPPNEVTAIYFFLWYMAFYFSWTLFEIPHLAWGGELTDDADQKTKVYMYRYIFGYAGTLCFYAMPFLPFIEGAELGPDVLRWSVLYAGLMLIPSLWWCVNNVPSGKAIVDEKIKAINLKMICNHIVKDKNLKRFLCAYLLAGAGAGMWVGMLYVFVDVYLVEGDKLPLLYISGTLSGILAMIFWCKLSILIGKRRALISALIGVSVCTFMVSFLQPNGSYLFLFLIIVTVYFFYSALQVLAPSILSDIADRNLMRTRVDQRAIYFSLYSLATKCNFAIGGASAFLIADLYWFNPTETVFSDHNVFGLKLSSSIIPSLLLLISTVFIMAISHDNKDLLYLGSEDHT